MKKFLDTLVLLALAITPIIGYAAVETVVQSQIKNQEIPITETTATISMVIILVACGICYEMVVAMKNTKISDLIIKISQGMFVYSAAQMIGITIIGLTIMSEYPRMEIVNISIASALLIIISLSMLHFRNLQKKKRENKTKEENWDWDKIYKEQETE